MLGFQAIIVDGFRKKGFNANNPLASLVSYLVNLRLQGIVKSPRLLELLVKLIDLLLMLFLQTLPLLLQVC